MPNAPDLGGGRPPWITVLRDPPEIDGPIAPPTIPSTEQEGERELGCSTQRRKSTA